MDRARSGEKRVGGWAGAGINGLADKIISEAMLKKGSLAAPRAILSLSLLSGPGRAKGHLRGMLPLCGN